MRRIVLGDAADDCTLADMVFIPDLETLHAGGEGDRIAKFANVARWWKTISARPAWVRAKGG